MILLNLLIRVAVQTALPLRPYNLTDPIVLEILVIQKGAVRFMANPHARITMQTQCSGNLYCSDQVTMLMKQPTPS